MSYDFGTVDYKENLILSHTFELTDANVKSFHPSCNCLSVNKTGKQVSVKWKVAQPPLQSYASRKYVTIVFNNGEEEEIKLTATITK